MTKETTKSDLPAESMKLIHSGKVLKDEDTIGSCQIKANDFLVVMITKTKKPTATTTPTAAAAAATPTETTTTAVPPSTEPAPAPTIATTAPTAATTATVTSSSASSTGNEFPIDIVNNLTSMGFPEPEVRACLRASRGNPDLAVEFLMNGIPPALAGSTIAPSSSSSVAPAGSSSSSTSQGRPLDALRNHPQINQLRTLIQSNPQMLPSVLSQIAQQQPDLLQEINANQAEFLAIMNEAPGTSTSTTNPVSSSTSIAATATTETTTNPPFPSGANITDPLRDLNPAQLQALANAMGVTPDQLNAAAQYLSNLPPQQMDTLMRMHEAMAVFPDDEDDLPFDGEGEDLNEPAGGIGEGGIPGRPRTQVISLTADEMAAVQRLTELGFDRNLCVQAFLACDKNESLAANLLMDGGFGFDDFDNSSNQQNHPDDDMYD